MREEGVRPEAGEVARGYRKELGLTQEQVAESVGISVSALSKFETGRVVSPRRDVLTPLRQLSCQDALAASGDGRRRPPFTFIDLFAGIGGMRIAFEAAGGRCLFTSEWDKRSQQTYRENFGADEEIAGDIREVYAQDIPAHDLLVAGFPCQPFSIAGVSKKNALGRAHGFACQTQGTLFFDIVRILDFHRPAAFLLENVKNLISHDRGNTFRVILATLEEELGYNVKWKVIDARSVVPQHRERTFIVGFRDDDVDFDLNDIELPATDQGPRLGSILHPEDGSEEADFPYTEGDLARVSSKYTLTPRLWEYLQQYAKKHKAKGNGFGFGLVGRGDVTRTLSARYYKDGSEVLVKQKGRRRPRRLTPRECARLMGFDQKGRDPFKITVSDTQAYRQFGNAVAVPVVEAIARFMLPHLESRVIKRPAAMRGAGEVVQLQRHLDMRRRDEAAADNPPPTAVAS